MPAGVGVERRSLNGSLEERVKCQSARDGEHPQERGVRTLPDHEEGDVSRGEASPNDGNEPVDRVIMSRNLGRPTQQNLSQMAVPGGVVHSRSSQNGEEQEREHARDEDNPKVGLPLMAPTTHEA